MELGIKGKQVLVSGGSIGIGLAVARNFAREGADVAIFARNKARADKEANRIMADFGVKSFAVQCDVTDTKSLNLACDEVIKNFGGLDILISNAGAGSKETILKSDDEKWQHYIDLHLMASIRLSRFFAPYMKERKAGVIINTCSICARQPLWYEPIYNTTKAALVMFTKCLSNELIDDNIRVCGISPGLVLTPDWWNTAEKLAQTENYSAKEYLDKVALENAPIKRFASPEEVANFYVFLASEKASYCVGTNYYIDGGWLKVTE